MSENLESRSAHWSSAWREEASEMSQDFTAVNIQTGLDDPYHSQMEGKPDTYKPGFVLVSEHEPSQIDFMPFVIIKDDYEGACKYASEHNDNNNTTHAEAFETFGSVRQVYSKAMEDAVNRLIHSDIGEQNLQAHFEFREFMNNQAQADGSLNGREAQFLSEIKEFLDNQVQANGALHGRDPQLWSEIEEFINSQEQADGSLQKRDVNNVIISSAENEEYDEDGVRNVYSVSQFGGNRRYQESKP
ncbi:uncharacterized protein L201_006340 [Kwoniella dendrophila CBS 6074]|uniref:Uncharacterized protein n=1 Tax=Kwoniella dendrophila CBS 6074 TaxID=1295534 RepID=A0AAX4K0Z0_9TREE